MNKSIRLLPFLLLAGGLTFGQTPDYKTKFLSAEELRKNYRFQEALEIYKKIVEVSHDASLDKSVISSIANSENGLSMLEYGARPKVFGSINVPIKDFFLYYPDIADSTWVLVPTSLNKNKRDYPINNVLRNSIGKDIIFFSAQDTKGKWDIFNIRRIDETKWSTPEPLTELNSQNDEILPYVSRDGKKLYFSSNGLSGMGGFDLYVSYWDEKRKVWDTPQNMGFPYSSPYDDYLFMDTDGGEYSVFASNRNCASKDSITIYKLGFESNPVKSPITSTEEAVRIAALSVRGSNGKSDKPSLADTSRTSPETNEYTKMIKEVRKVQAEIDENMKHINANRTMLGTTTNEEDKAYLIKKISEDEMQLLDQQSRLTTANQAIQHREMDFLSRGVIIPREELVTEKREEVAEVLEPFVAKLSLYGSLPHMEVMEPVVTVDYSFRTKSMFYIIEEKVIPDDLFYTVQLFLVSEKADSAAFKGIAPIFETITKSGKFNYTVGRFYSYKEVSDIIPQLKSMGFHNIVPVAYHKGENISIKSARLLEESIAATNTYQVKLISYPDGIPQPVLEIIRKSTDKDIAMKIIDGKNIYFVGPFTNKSAADQLVTALGEVAGDGVSVEVTENK